MTDASAPYFFGFYQETKFSSFFFNFGLNLTKQEQAEEETI